MATLPEIYTKLDQYLLLPDKDVIKLLIAFVIGCKLPTPPPWLFLASGSSTGKTDLLALMKKVAGYYPVDNMTRNTLLSGMKSHEGQTSLLKRIPTNGFLVFSDFTVLLNKNKDELGEIISQFRPMYDGEYTRATGGQQAEQTWNGKAGMLGGCTTAIYTKTEDFAEMGQRMVIYHMPQPDDYEVGRFNFHHRKTDRKSLQQDIQDTIAAYVQSIVVPTSYDQLPDFDPQTEQDILDIGHLAVTARSPVSRAKFHRDHPLESREDKEGIGRVQKQLMTLSYGLMLQNDGQILTDGDRKLLYKIGLDCIDPRRRAVLQTLTEYSFGGDVDQIADRIAYPRDTTTRFVDDLFTLGMLEKKRMNYGHGSKSTYKLKTKFQTIMQRFEGITPTDEALPASTDPVVPLDNLTPPPEPDAIF